MGIPKFRQWLKDKNIKFDISKEEAYAEGIMIDMNDLLHFFAGYTFGYGDDITPERKREIDKTPYQVLESQYLNHLTTRLEEYLQRFHPQQYIIVAVDGVAPLAKISQQRKRRYSTRGKMDTDKFTNMMITPGTPFMDKIDKHLSEWFSRHGSLPPFSAYSSHRIPGEGEHKMTAIIRQEIEKGTISQKGKGGPHIVTGQDSDLFMISSLLPINKVVVYREERKGKQIRLENSFFSIPKFRRTIDLLIGRDRMSEFITATFMYGNDFFPHPPMFHNANVAFNTIIAAYNKLDGSKLIGPDGKINREVLVEFFQHMAPFEQDLLLDFAKQYNPARDGEYPILLNNSSRGPTGRLEHFDFNGYRRDWYARIMDLTGCKDVDTLIVNMTENYINMLQWNLDYYKGLPDISWNRMYGFPFPPLFYDLAAASPIAHIRSSIKDEDDPSPSIIRQLLMVIHPKIIPKVLPESFANLIQLDGPLADLSPDAPIFFQDGKGKSKDDGPHHLWTVFLPKVDSEVYDLAIEENVDPKIFKMLPDYLEVIDDQEPEIYTRDATRTRASASSGASPGASPGASSGASPGASPGASGGASASRSLKKKDSKYTWSEVPLM